MTQVIVVQAPAKKAGCLGTIGNILWLFIGGVPLALSYLFAAVLCIVFIVTIPFAVQCAKLAGYALWPFGKTVAPDPNAKSSVSSIGNVLWFVIGGWWLTLSHIFAGVLLCCTVIGIPFGIQCFKLARLAWWPFGKQIVRA